MSPRWISYHNECSDFDQTDDGMTDFIRKFRGTLLYCKNEGNRSECSKCAANRLNGFGDSAPPPIRFTKGWTTPNFG